MAPAALPPAFPDVAADGHLPSSSPEALPVDVPLSWESAPPPPPLLSPTSSSTLLLSSPTTVATTSPVDPTEVVSTAPSLAAPEADPFLRPDGSDDGRWAAPHPHRCLAFVQPPFRVLGGGLTHCTCICVWMVAFSESLRVLHQMCPPPRMQRF